MATIYDYSGNAVVVSGNNQFEPSTNDIPLVFIDGNLPQAKSEGNVGVVVSYSSKKQTFKCYATLKVQGDSSATYPKKNFTIKLFDDSAYKSKRKITFRQWDERNKFVLKANWMDHSHARNVVNARLWTQIMKSRPDFLNLPETLRQSNLAVDGFPVRVYNNGVYQGLYTWNLPKDGMYNVDDGIDENCILNSEKNNDQSCAFNGTSITNWSDELHDTMPVVISIGWGAVLSFVSTSSDSNYITGIDNYIDLQSIIDFDIFARLCCMVDNLCKNQIFFTYNGSKWYEGAYDMDGTWGLPPIPSKGWFPYNTVFQSGYVAATDFNIENKLYSKTERLFLSRFKERYHELRNGILSEDNIIYQFESFINPISDDLYAKDYSETTGGGAFVNIPFKDTNNIQQIKTFVPQRLSYMDSVIQDMN